MKLFGIGAEYSHNSEGINRQERELRVAFAYLRTANQQMPFSLSHAGFVAPLRGFLLPHHLLALMVGSLAPDFGYYIRNYELSGYSHTLAGALVACLPLGLLAFVLAILFLRYVDCLLPEPHRGMLRSSRLSVLPRPKRTIGISVAVLIGALLHNFVDSFTHETGAAVARVDVLKTDVFDIAGEAFPIYRLLQYAGSLIGIAMLFYAYWQVARQHCRANDCPLWQDRDRWWTLTGITIVSAAIVAIPYIQHFFRDGFGLASIRGFVFQFLTTWPLVLAACLLVAATVRRYTKP